MSDDREHQAAERETEAVSPGGRDRPNGELPREGDVVGSKYRVEQVLGAGGMGVVVAATHLDLGHRVALKFLKVENPGADLIERLRREARITFRLRSDHIARLLDVGTLGSGAPYLVLEHLDGKDLARVLRSRGPLPIAEGIDFLLQAGVAVAEAHRLGIVHRDLKPSNLFLVEQKDQKPSVKVLDFGVAKALDHGLGGGDAITTTTAVVGSPLYMSPEQVRGARDVDARSDIWALGVILHELLTGKPPFAAGPASAVCAAIAADAPAKLRTLRPDAPAALEAIILKCLEKDPAKRFPNVGAFAVALGRFAPPTSAVVLREIAALTRSSALADSNAASAVDLEAPARSPRSRAALLVATAMAALAALTLARARFVGSDETVERARSVGAAAMTRAEKALAERPTAIDAPPPEEPAKTVEATAQPTAPVRAEAPRRRPPPAIALASATASAPAPTSPERAAEDLEIRATSRRH